MTTSREKVDAALSLVNEADRLGTIRERVYARDELINAATFFGRPDISLVAFNWNLANDPDFEARENECWIQFRWIAQDILTVPTVSAGEIEHVLHLMAYYWKKFGFTEYPLDQANAMWCHFRGAPPSEAEPYAERVIQYLHDRHTLSIDDYQAIFECHYYTHAWDDCRLVAKRIFECGEISDETPHVAYCESAELFLDVGDLEQAETCFSRGYEMCRNTPVFLRQIADLLLYALRTGKGRHAARMVVDHYPWTIKTVDGWGELKFFVAATMVAQAGLLTEDDISRLVVHAPELESVSLVERFKSRADELIDAFDSRNGNDARRRWADAQTA